MSGGGRKVSKTETLFLDYIRKNRAIRSFSPKLNNFRGAPAQSETQMRIREFFFMKSSCEKISNFISNIASDAIDHFLLRLKKIFENYPAP